LKKDKKGGNRTKMVTQDGQEKQSDVTLTTGNTKTPKFTQAQVDKAVRDATSAVGADIGRLKAESEKAMKAAQAAQARLEQMQKDQEQAELEAAREEPDKLAVIRERQARKKAEAELATERQIRTEYEARLKQTDAEKAEATRKENVKAIAAKQGVDPVKLDKLAKFTDGSLEAIEDIAKDLPKAQKGNLRLDPGNTLGGSVTFEEVREAFINNPYDLAVKQRYLEMKAQRK
jgi:hypothetical protein